MELALKMILTGSVVTALVLVANRFGEVIGGLLSGLPFTTAPALLLMGRERGLAMAADAAIGGIVGCALASVFALAYHGAARRLAPAPTVGIAIACMAASVWMLSQLSMTLALAGVVTCACTAGALLFIRDPLAGKRSAPLRNSRETWPAVSIGLLSAAMPAAVIEMNASLAGIVATMPMLGIALAASCHVRRGRAAVPTYLRAYVVSSFAKAVFCAVFAVCVMAHGLAVALLAACLLAGLVCALAIAVKPTARITPTPRRRRTDAQVHSGWRERGVPPTEHRRVAVS